MLSAASAASTMTSSGASARRLAIAGKSDPSASAKKDATAAAATRDRRPQHEPREEPDGRAQRDVDVSVDAAGQRNAAPRLGEAETMRPIVDGADDVGDAAPPGRARPAIGAGKPEDSAADGDVDDARRQPPGTPRARTSDCSLARGSCRGIVGEKIVRGGGGRTIVGERERAARSRISRFTGGSVQE